MSIVQVQFSYIVQETPEDVKAQFTGAKDWEVLDPDGMRYTFSDTEQEGRDEVHNVVYDMLVSSNFSLTTAGGDA